MKTIKDILNYDDIKNLGSMSHDEMAGAIYKAMYNDYAIDKTSVVCYTVPDMGLTFDLMAMWFGNLPFLGYCKDGTVDKNNIPIENMEGIPQKACYNGIVEDSPLTPIHRLERRTGGQSSMTLHVDNEVVTGHYTKNNTKFNSWFRCKDLDRFFKELRPIMVLEEHFFANTDNGTLYQFGIKWHNYTDIIFNMYMLYGHDTDIAKELDFFNEYFEPMEDNERQPNIFHYLYKTISGLGSQSLEMDFYDISNEFINKNYNDDLPYDKIEKFVNGDESGICLLHGEPGTGKSTFIKHLIGKYTNTTFFYIPSSLMAQVNENDLANYILQTQAKSVYIIEDCEALISDRNKGYNAILPTLLNFSDGIVGGALKPKFILTFNCPITQIDKAVLRKGRLKIKYDFKALCLEKTKVLYPEATGPMPLCDIYNREDNGNETSKKKIGF